MKIDAAKTTELRVEQSRLPADKAGAGAAKAAEADAARSVRPAASVEINSASIAAAAAAKAQNNELDKKLLDQIRQQIASGEYQVDYDRIAQSMLSDMISAQLSRVKK